MDETALIAFGILMEETAKEVLGETGDLVFTEGADEGSDGHSGGGTRRSSIGVEDSDGTTSDASDVHMEEQSASDHGLDDGF